MELTPLLAFNDNYIWMMRVGHRVWVVDPGQSEPVTQTLKKQGLELEGILITHHHGDHIGGVRALREATGAPVHGPAKEAIPQPYFPHRSGDSINVMGTTFTVMEVPGHTAGHIAWLGQPAQQAPLLFCGDTLFSAGCGRLFEGTAEQLHESLQALAALSDETRVCCAHEYTVSNLRFAAAIEPDNPDILAHTTWCLDRRDRGEPTLPSTIGLEKRINPFLRLQHSAIRAAAISYDPHITNHPASVLGALRQWKNEF